MNKIVGNVLLILIIYLAREIANADNRQCVCVSYEDCEFNYTLKSTVSEYHEIRAYDENRPRPSCESAIDVCCNLKDDNSRTDNYSPDEKEERTDESWTCGRRGAKNKRNGPGLNVDAVEGEFPWMVAVMIKERVYGGKMVTKYHCGGTLINPKVVLTSAREVHRLRPSTLTARIGSLNWKCRNGKHQDVEVDSVLIHPNFNPRSYVNNYALLILSEPVESNENVNSICLAESNGDYNKTDCIETGWGESKQEINRGSGVLKKSNLNIVEHKTCENIYQMNYNNDRYVFHKSVLCAGDDRLRSPGTGNGGSPLICQLKNKKDRYVQVGISSVSVNNENYKPGLYADVSFGLTWINRQFESHNLKSKSYIA